MFANSPCIAPSRSPPRMPPRCRRKTKVFCLSALCRFYPSQSTLSANTPQPYALLFVLLFNGHTPFAPPRLARRHPTSYTKSKHDFTRSEVESSAPCCVYLHSQFATQLNRAISEYSFSRVLPFSRGSGPPAVFTRMRIGLRRQRVNVTRRTASFFNRTMFSYQGLRHVVQPYHQNRDRRNDFKTRRDSVCWAERVFGWILRRTTSRSLSERLRCSFALSLGY